MDDVRVVPLCQQLTRLFLHVRSSFRPCMYMYVVDLSCHVAKHAAVDVGICMPIVSAWFPPTKFNYHTRVFPRGLRPQKWLTVVKLATLSSTEREKVIPPFA